MTRLSKDEIDEILRKHELWVEDEDAEGGERAVFRGIDFYGVDFSGRDLSYINFVQCDLTGTNFENANFNGQAFTRCNVERTDFTNASIDNTKFYMCRVRCTFKHTTFYNTRFTQCDLMSSSFDQVSNIDEVMFQLSDMTYVLGLPPIACPSEGEFIGYKAAICNLGNKPVDVILRLRIPSDAFRSSATGKKCRCSKAEVLDASLINGTLIDSAFSLYSHHDHEFKYTIGETVAVHNFDMDRWCECAPGIHFFMTRDDVVDYIMATNRFLNGLSYNGMVQRWGICSPSVEESDDNKEEVTENE